MAGYKVLLVDDDEEFVANMAKRLREQGATVTYSIDPNKAIELMQQDDFDVAVIDRRMPELSGEDLFAVIRSRWPNTKIIMLTGYGTVTQAFGLAKGGLFGYLGKPCSANHLFKMIQQAVGEIV